MASFSEFKLKLEFAQSFVCFISIFIGRSLIQFCFKGYFCQFYSN